MCSIPGEAPQLMADPPCRRPTLHCLLKRLLIRTVSLCQPPCCSIPGEAPQLVADLVRACLDVDPAKRPAMEDIIAALQVGQHSCLVGVAF